MRRQLSRDVTFGPNVQCIYYDQVDQTEPTTGCIAGWGARDVRIHIIEQQECI